MNEEISAFVDSLLITLKNQNIIMDLLSLRMDEQSRRIDDLNTKVTAIQKQINGDNNGI